MSDRRRAKRGCRRLDQQHYSAGRVRLDYLKCRGRHQSAVFLSAARKWSLTLPVAKGNRGPFGLPIHQMNDKKNTLLAVGAVGAILGSLAFLYFTQFRHPTLSLKPLESLGYVSAEETAKLLNQQGSVVLVCESEEGTRSPNSEAQVKGFNAAMAKLPGVTLKTTQDLKRSMDGDPRQWPAGHAEQLARLGAGAGAVVFIGSMPQEFTKADLAALQGSKCKFVVVTAQAPSLKPLLQQGIIHLAIVNRLKPQPAPSRTETPRQWFDRVYLVAKPDALGELP